MADEGRSLKAQPTRDTLRCVIIVARDETDLWHYMARDFGEFKGLQVILDRRQRERRQQVQRYQPERRREERRHPPTMDEDLRRQPFVIVLGQQAALEG
jgi:hypothetical protein